MLNSAEIGQRIRTAREEAGLSQEQLGRRLSPPKSHAAVSDIERGKTRVTVSELSRIAVVLSRPLEFFLGATSTAVYRRGDTSVSDGRALRKAIDRFKEDARKAARDQNNP